MPRYTDPNPGPGIDDIFSRWGPPGLQPNGMIHLGGGRMWNPSDGIPPGYAAPAPGTTPPIADNPMPAPTAPSAPQGMMFSGLPTAPATLPIQDPGIMAPIVPRAKPGYDDVGGLHEKLNQLSADLLLLGGNTQGAATVQDELSKRMQQRQEANKQSLEYQREQARLNKPQVHFGDDGSVISFDPVTMKTTVLQQGRAKEDTKPEIQRTYEYLQSIGRSDLAESFLKNKANPLMGVPTMDAQGNQGLAFVPRGGYPTGGAGVTGPMPTPAGGAPTPGPATALSGNNPGGIIDGSFARRQPGYTGSNGKFAGFRTPADGANAQKALLRSYIQRGFDTPLKIASRWAPAGVDNNDPSAYAAGIARQLGIGVNDRVGLNDVDRFQPAQAMQENSMYHPQAGASAAPPQSSGGFPPSPYPTIMTKPAPNKLTSMGQDKGNPVPVRSPQEAAALPPGTYFRDPTGNIRQRH
jgi:hypothetical protein